MMPRPAILFSKLIGDEWWGCPRCLTPKFPVRARKKPGNPAASSEPNGSKERLGKKTSSSEPPTVADSHSSNVFKLGAARWGGGIGHFDLGIWWVEEFSEEERTYIRDIQHFYNGKELDEEELQIKEIASGRADGQDFDRQISKIDSGVLPMDLRQKDVVDFLYDWAETIWFKRGESGFGVDLALRFLNKAESTLGAVDVVRRFSVLGFKVECLWRMLREQTELAVEFENACQELIRFSSKLDQKRDLLRNKSKLARFLLPSASDPNSVVHPGYMRLLRHLEAQGKLQEAVDLCREAHAGGWGGPKWLFNIKRLEKRMAATQ
jgi:hypothetical protein